jgi:2-dehydro-3-deoxyphosphooctonate aldolase (KDO 8-P synthase)
VFIETHREPANAPSDGANMLYLRDLRPLLSQLIELDYIVKGKKTHG